MVNGLQGEFPILEQERFVSGGEYGGSDAESGGLSGSPCLVIKIYICIAKKKDFRI